MGRVQKMEGNTLNYADFYPTADVGGTIQDPEFFTRRKIMVLGSHGLVWHSLSDLIFIDQILSRYNFDTIIEFGTMNGGSTALFMIHALRTDGSVYSFDIRIEPLTGLYKILKGITKTTYHKMDVFSDAAQNIVSKYFKNGRVLLYCDNGKKNQEFNTYAHLLKTNDVIMAHDKDTEVFWSEIAKTTTKENLVPFHQDLANKIGAGIFSFIKKEVPPPKETGGDFSTLIRSHRKALHRPTV